VDESRTSRIEQVEAIIAGAQFQLLRWQERAHILRAVLRGIEQFDTVAALIRSSESAGAARLALMDLLDIDEVQVRAVVGMQVLRLAGRERMSLADEYDEAMAHVTDMESILGSPERQRELIGTERGDYLVSELVSRNNRRGTETSDSEIR
jgi:DNA gyrase subunit A